MNISGASAVSIDNSSACQILFKLPLAATWPRGRPEESFTKEDIMSTSRQKQLTWDLNGVERMEFFMAERIAYYVVEKAGHEWSGYEDDLTEKLRYVQAERMDGRATPDYLSHSVSVAGNIMGNMMAQELMKLLLPPEAIAGLVEDAIARAIKDEEYDREFKEPEEYAIPKARARQRRSSGKGYRVSVSVSRLP